MTVRRIVPNIAVERVGDADAFYRGVLGMEVVMDLGFIVAFASPAEARQQVSVASEGGSGTPVPDLSVEVDDVDAMLSKVREAGVAVEYGPVDEPWGVRRFYVRDPFGRLVNILMHRNAD